MEDKRIRCKLVLWLIKFLTVEELSEVANAVDCEVLFSDPEIMERTNY